MLTEAQVIEQALELPPAQRAAVVDRLLESLQPDEAAQSEIDQAWAEEIERRASAYDRGETKSIDAREAIQRIRQSLKAKRAS